MEVNRPAVCTTSTNFADPFESRSVVRENIGAVRGLIDFTLWNPTGNTNQLGSMPFTYDVSKCFG